MFTRKTTRTGNFIIKTLFLKSLSELALYCLLASHSEQTLSQNADSLLVIPNKDLTIRLQHVNQAALDLNASLFEMSKRNITQADIENAAKLQSYIISRYEFIESICNEFDYKDPVFKNNLNITKQNINVMNINLETFTKNYYIKNGTALIIEMLLNTILERYPMLEIPLKLILQYGP
jgi:hypothetical protein